MKTTHKERPACVPRPTVDPLEQQGKYVYGSHSAQFRIQEPHLGSSAMNLGDASKLQSPYPTECFLCPSGSLSRAGPLPLLRQPPIMQPPMDLKQILPFPLEPAPTLGLFSNYSTVSTVRLPLPCPLACTLHFQSTTALFS